MGLHVFGQADEDPSSSEARGGVAVEGLAAAIRPPTASTKPFQIESPKPMPRRDRWAPPDGGTCPKPAPAHLADALALILDADHDVAAVLIGRDLDVGVVRAVGDGVLQHVDDRLLKEAGVGLYEAQLGGEVAGGAAAGEPSLHPLDGGGEDMSDRVSVTTCRAAP